jgi:hypothetical protein
MKKNYLEYCARDEFAAERKNSAIAGMEWEPRLAEKMVVSLDLINGYSPIARSGHLFMYHPDNGRVCGNLCGLFGQSYIDGVLTEKEFMFIEEHDNRKNFTIHNLEKDRELFIGNYKSTNKNIGQGVVELDILKSVKFYKPADPTYKVPFRLPMNEVPNIVLDFWRGLEIRGHENPYAEEVVAGRIVGV